MGKLQRGVVIGLDNLSEIGVFGSLKAPDRSIDIDLSLSEPVYLLRWRLRR